MEHQPSFFDTYPASPGWKARATSQAAAEAMRPKAPLVRDKILKLFREYPLAGWTADEAAEALRIDRLTTRPRFSELAAEQRIVDSGQRRSNDSGRSAIVWRLA